MADMTIERALRVLDAHLTYVSDDKDWQEAEDALATLRAEIARLEKEKQEIKEAVALLSNPAAMKEQQP